MNEPSPSDDGAPGFSPAECRAWLEGDVIARLQAFSDMQMAMAQKIAAKGEEDGADLVRLNAAMAKAGRALRFTAMLQLEVAGLRRQPGVREPVAVNQNEPQDAPEPQDRWGRKRLGQYEHIIEDARPSEVERVDREVAQELRDAHEKLRAAMDTDLKAAGRLLELNQSIATKARDYIRHIPHPATDACIQSLTVAFATYIFGHENLEPPRLKTGPPDTPTEWIADKMTPEELEKEMQRRGYA